MKLPVFTALRIKDPLQAEKILADGHADMIAMCRALISDPELPRKAKDEIYRSLKGKIHKIYAIGDCVAPRKVQDAIREGHRVGRMI